MKIAAVLSLIAIVPFVVANPMTISLEDVETLTISKPRPRHRGDRVASIDCDKKTRKCSAKMVPKGKLRPWLATWPLRSIRPIGHRLLDAEEMEMLSQGAIEITTVKCNGATHRCYGNLGRTALVAEWDAKVSRHLLEVDSYDQDSDNEQDIEIFLDDEYDDEDSEDITNAPVRVKSIGCERGKRTCTASLGAGRGGRVAQWRIVPVL